MTTTGRSKLTSIEDVFAGLTPGSTVAIGGVLDRRRPIELCRGLVATGIGGLHILSFLAGAETELLAAAGLVAELTTGYVDPGSGGADVEAGIASGTIALHEVSEHLYLGALNAAASGLPCWLTLGGAGSDVAADADLAEIRCPFTGRALLAVPAADIDLAIVHTAVAAEDGTVFAPDERAFLDDADIPLVRAARRVVVSADVVVPAGPDLARRGVIAGFEIDAVVHTPAGGDR